MSDHEEAVIVADQHDSVGAQTAESREGLTSQDAPAVASSSILQEHSNANLLKINTHDKYSTVGAIKKFIIKSLPPPATQAPPLPLFPGMHRIGKNPSNPHIFLAFDTADQRQQAADLLVTLCYRKLNWEVDQVSDRDLQLTHKGRTDNNGGDKNNANNKRPRNDAAVDGDPSCGTSSSSSLGVCPWANVPLDEQNQRKERHCISVMKKILPPNVHNGFVAYRTKFLGVVRSATTEGYRNHVNFTFGHDATGAMVVGFNEGSIVDGKLHVQAADQAGNVTTNPIALCIVRAFQSLCDALFAESNGTIRVLDRVNGTGFWRRLQVRHNVDGEVMICLELDPTGLPGTQRDEQDAYLSNIVLPRIVASLTTAGNPLNTSLQAIQSTSRVISVQYYTHSGTASTPFEVQRTVVFGVPTLCEKLVGLSFDLNPAAFFQVNTPAFEDLLDRVRNVAHLTTNTVLLDLCCGTGTIGICLARHVKKVIGIELIASAVDNARENAARNGIQNATFHAGRVENLLPDVLKALAPEDRVDIVAILDPPRAGVHNTVLKWIRSLESIRRAVYISCEQKALENDCPGLTKPATNTYRGAPFVIESGFGIDLFPHTPHVEMIVVLDRSAAAASPTPSTVEVVAEAAEPNSEDSATLTAQ